MTKKVKFIYKVMIMTTYMLAYTIRNIQNEVRKKKKISSKRSKNRRIKGKKIIEKKGKVSCNFNFTNVI